MTPSFSPSYDTKIARRYSASSLEQKVANKTALQRELGWPAEPKRALLCLPAGMTTELGGDLLEELIPGLLTLPLEMLIVGKGPAKFGALFTKLAKDHSHKIAIIPATDDATRKMYAAADIALFLRDPKSQDELSHALAYGVIPVCPETRGLENYDPVQESGNAFFFERPTVWHAFTAIVRALETHRFPFDWRTIQRHAMEKVSVEK